MKYSQPPDPLIAPFTLHQSTFLDINWKDKMDKYLLFLTLVED